MARSTLILIHGLVVWVGSAGSRHSSAASVVWRTPVVYRVQSSVFSTDCGTATQQPVVIQEYYYSQGAEAR